MAKLLMMTVVGAVLFGLSATASWYLQPATDESGEESASETTEVDTTQVTTETTEDPDRGFQPGGIPAETVLRLGESIKKREQQLRQREELVESQEKRLKFMIDDLQRERNEIDSMLAEAEASSQQARTLLEQVQENSSAAAGATEQSKSTAGVSNPEETRKPMSEAELSNLRTVAEWLKGMPAEQAAESIRVMSNDGKMEMAVHVLSFLEQRDAAKILAALQDAALVTEIAQKMLTLERPAKK